LKVVGLFVVVVGVGAGVGFCLRKRVGLVLVATELGGVDKSMGSGPNELVVGAGVGFCLRKRVGLALVEGNKLGGTELGGVDMSMGS